MYENAPDDLIMHEHVCDGNAWECMRMYDSDSYSGEGWVIQTWFTLAGRLGWHMLTSAPPPPPIHSYHDTPILVYLEEGYKHCECMRMHENGCEWLRMTHIHVRVGSCHADAHYMTCMILHVNASDYLIMHEHVCDENAWTCMRMSENGQYSGRAVWVIYGWVALYDMHDGEWEYMRIAWERVRIAHIKGGRGWWSL